MKNKSELNIASINVKDNKANRNGNLENAKKLSKIIEQFDLIGTQEFTVKYVNEVMKNLDSYKIYDNYRYGKILKNMPYNENNGIITNQSVLSSNTIWLPWIANNFRDLTTSIIKMSIMPRIATVVISDTKENGKICMINTHLDYQIPSIQIKQLKAIKKLINQYGKDYPVFLTGDFNMELDDKNFSEFVKSINDDLEHVDIKEKTWHGKSGEEKSLDHIFISKDFYIENSGITSTQGTSDHDVIYATVSKRR